jgi:membrane-bound lytic murein transglycosylase B
MRLAVISLKLFFFYCCAFDVTVHAKPGIVQDGAEHQGVTWGLPKAPLEGGAAGESSSSSSRLLVSGVRGWNYLAQKLVDDGEDKDIVRAIFADSRMPQFEPIPFALMPRETAQQYRGFFTPGQIKLAKEALRHYRANFDKAEERFAVEREVLAAILLIESQLGRVTGEHLVFVRLARVASVAEPRSLRINYQRLKREDKKVSFEQVEARAKHLEKTFYPEVRALLQIKRDYQIDLFRIKGSRAGAFGIPQFLPSSFLLYGIDGNGDGNISLFSDGGCDSFSRQLSGQSWLEQ